MGRASGLAREHLRAYLQELCLAEAPDSPALRRPDVEDAKYDDVEQREAADLAEGAVLRATLRAGEGGSSPASGDLVLVHYVCRRSGGAVLAGSREEHGGTGAPVPFLLGGKGRRAPRSWELCVQQMEQGEVCVITSTPAYAYEHPACGMSRPEQAGADEKLEFELELLRWYPAEDCGAVGLSPGDDAGPIFKRVLAEGGGWERPREPFEVLVDCTLRQPSAAGELGTGAVVSSHEAVEVALGAGQVGPHLEAALCSMLKGERAAFLSPADPGPAWRLPCGGSAGQLLEYELHLRRIVQVRDMTGDGSVTKRRVRDGVGEFPMDCPLEDCAVRVHYKLRAAGAEVYDTRAAGPPAEFALGDGAFPPGMEMAVRLMTPQEVSVVRAEAKYAYDTPGLSPQATPVPVAAGLAVEWEIELLDFDKAPNWHPMPAAERIPLIESMKAAANKLFGDKRYAHAKAKYQKALKVVNHTFDASSEEEQDGLAALRAALNLNMAAVLHKEEDYSGAVAWSNKVLEEDADHAKALYRRGNAYLEAGEYASAVADFVRYGAAAPSDGAHAEAMVDRARRREAAAAARQREQMKGFLVGR
mmetsp:Transcript_41826/g.108277  ORF Transcript_41826/g.108277 Transcript_41826/m.108277 type:complete len:588 (+) Transcript_41826:113-1876(+)